MRIVQEALTFDDVLLVPAYSEVLPREVDLSTRLTDFCSGLTYARNGSLELLGDMVVLLAPPHVELSSDSLGGLQEGRFFNQV